MNQKKTFGTAGFRADQTEHLLRERTSVRCNFSFVKNNSQKYWNIFIIIIIIKKDS